MSDFVVSARKYRPITFDEVVGQHSITATLKNAIKNQQLAQSFLFCGPRGVGKTTCARILAKAINCTQLNDNIECCNSCESCKAFNESHSFNIHELDAASNNSVDDIRNLVDQVRFAPQVGDYNIYIIDEVHMLSQAAFNAFLKTLEEPPKHAKFILATTEKHKIIPTILSRCQIFDFKRVGVEDISKHLDFVAESEGISTEAEALYTIAQKADGALRDALSIFDRLASFSDKQLTYKSVIEHLNILDYDYYFKVTDAILEHNIPNLMIQFDAILGNGFDGHHFINGLATHLRDLLICKDEKTIVLLDKGESIHARYLAQAKQCDVNNLISALQLCNECDVQYKTTKNQRLLVELCLMRLASINTDLVEKKSPKSFIVANNKETTPEAKPKKEVVPQDEPNVEKTQKTSFISEIEAPKETKKPTIKLEKTNGKSKTISISGLLEKQKIREVKNDTEEQVQTLRNTPFTEEIFAGCWKAFVQQLNKEGKMNLSIALGNYPPKIMENNCVEVSLSNASQVELIQSEKHQVLEYLRNKLENDYIEITTKVIEGEKSNIPYTNKDKFAKMMDENPHLETLRLKLGLDPDY